VTLAGPAGIRIGAGVCFLLWSVSLLLPAVNVMGGPTLSGAGMLEQGWQAIGNGVPSWYANPIFLLATLAALLAKPRVAGVLMGIGLTFALTSFAAAELARSNGSNVPRLVWQAGFYCWLIAQSGLLVWCCVAALLHRDGAR
jgi:hypothetical protein